MCIRDSICQLKERDYRDKDEFDYAPQDYADAMDSYDKILEITGEITGCLLYTSLPIVLTVNGSAAPCRPRNAKLLQKYKRALGAQEKAAITKMCIRDRLCSRRLAGG